MSKTSRLAGMMLGPMLFGLAGCGNFTDVAHFEQKDEVSGCGGFAANQSPLLADPPAYCSAEVLHWTYDPATEKLSFNNTRVFLNCCGTHTMELSYLAKESTYLLTETDAPDSTGYRCGCMCVFDYTMTVEGIPNEPMQLRLVRNVTDDQQGPQIIYEGRLDLSAGAGWVVTDENPVNPAWCNHT